MRQRTRLQMLLLLRLLWAPVGHRKAEAIPLRLTWNPERVTHGGTLVARPRTCPRTCRAGSPAFPPSLREAGKADPAWKSLGVV